MLAGERKPGNTLILEGGRSGSRSRQRKRVEPKKDDALKKWMSENLAKTLGCC